MKIETLKLKIEFTEHLLGTMTNNPDIYENFMKSKVPEVGLANEETAVIESVSKMIEKSSTVFPSDDVGLFIWNYQWKGFIKEAVGALTELGDIKGLTKWTYKRVVDLCIFVNPRRIRLFDNTGSIITNVTREEDFIVRPLRAETMQGERVALARSQCVPAGTTCCFEVNIMLSSNTKSKLSSIDTDVVKAALDYGKVRGLGQWRNSGAGTFKWALE